MPKRRAYREGIPDDALAFYLKGIVQIPLLDKEEELKLGAAIQRGEERAFKKLVEANLRFVVKVAMRYQGCGLSLADLINEGNLGLLEAARRYSPEHNVKFITYAVWWIRQAIMQALARNGSPVRFPLRKIRQASRFKELRADLTQTLQAEPTGQELAEELHLSLEEVDELLGRSAWPSSLSDDAREQERLSLELYKDQLLPPEEAELIGKFFREEVDRMLRHLTPRERQVIELRFGLGGQGPLTLEEVGKRLNLSRERVRQIEGRAKQRLKLLARVRHLRDYLN
ncbi:MAG: RNA polymerase sigma factor RpoD/SigA [candidate division NC10 bacterium]|nr:RNA polymerase sigma factor RpoD/SigA [candidate division NC10 bacterium]